MALKINGLVRAFRDVRQQLTAGVTRYEKQQFIVSVKRTVASVEQICRQQGCSPDDLPAPSRNAFYFLKHLDTSKIPIRHLSADGDSPSTIRIENIVKMGEFLSEQCWLDLERALDSSADLEKLRSQFSQEVLEIERICQKMGGNPQLLPQPSLKTYCWMSYLSNPSHLIHHLGALNNVRTTLRSHAQGVIPEPVVVHLYNIRYIYRVQQNADGVILRCCEGLQAAPADVWAEIVNSIYKRRRRSHPKLNEFIISDAFKRVVAVMNAPLLNGKNRVKGRFYNLDEVFDRVNKAFFSGKMKRPLLCWNDRLTVGKMGHYHHPQDEIMISVTLDQSDVPAFVVEFVMYHEMLHKKLGLRRKNGKNWGHTAVFRKEEQRFPRCREAHSFLKALSIRQRERSAKH